VQLFGKVRAGFKKSFARGLDEVAITEQISLFFRLYVKAIERLRKHLLKIVGCGKLDAFCRAAYRAPARSIWPMDVDSADFAYVPTTGVHRYVEAPVVEATDESLRGYGCLVDQPAEFPIEIVRWPAPGWRPVDHNSGDQGGITEGLFEFWWKEQTLYARNHAVGDSYLFGWSRWPDEPAAPAAGRERALHWRANYHPDGGQLFYPQGDGPFVIPLALAGDDVTPEKFITFWCDGTRGLYIHPSIWHGALVPIADQARFLDRQGRVHARISVNFPKEFGCYLATPLGRPPVEPLRPASRA
jgi:ureidoglycolate lyase